MNETTAGAANAAPADLHDLIGEVPDLAADNEETTVDIIGDLDPDGALAVVERIVAHVPADEPAGTPRVIGPGVVITDDDQRFEVEHDAEEGEFVTRARAIGGGTVELTVFQEGSEVGRKTVPLDMGSS